MNKFNILYIENFSDIIGGGQISLLNLLERLKTDVFTPIVVCPGEGTFVDALKKRGIETYSITMGSLKDMNVIGFFRSIEDLRKLMRDKRIDLIHANGSRACFYAGIAAREKQIPVIWHVRIADSDGLWDRVLANLSSRIIVISDAVSKRFDWMRDKERKVTTIYNGIDLEKFNPSLNGGYTRKEFGLNAQVPLVGMVGRLDRYKGYPYLLKAARKVIDAIPECRFLIVGEGERRKELEDLTNKLSLNNNVIFTGYREDVPEVLASLDLFVLSSVSEGLGRSIIEAMAMRKAVVATDVGGIPEIVKDKETGLLVASKDSDALAKAITELLVDKNKVKLMGLAGRKRAEERFDLDTHLKMTQKLYMDLLT